MEATEEKSAVIIQQVIFAQQAVEFSARITRQLTIMTRIRALTRFPADSRVMLYPQTTIVNISSSNRELNLSIWIIFCPESSLQIKNQVENDDL